jgi:putative transposase
MQSRPRGLRELCRLLGYTPQAYYQYKTGFENRQLKEELILQQVACHRKLQPRLGARKLLLLMRPFMAASGIAIGRDMFFELLRVNGVLIRKSRRGTRTTFSNHGFKKYPDLVKGRTVNRADELWVSDITYIQLRKGFAYLSLVTDVYSRKIVGYRLNNDLSSQGCLLALEMAIQSRGTIRNLIHHSDRGIQYCSAAYVRMLEDNQVSISMTQDGNPRDNAIAERVNGILKQELLSPVYNNYQQAKQAVSMAINTYNHLRPHSSVDMLTPASAYMQSGEIRRRWKSYYRTIRKEAVMDG